MISKTDAERNGVATKDGGSRLQAGNQALREKLRELLPPLVNGDGQLDLKSLKEIMDVANGGGNDQGYELTFAGKGYARAQASAPTAHELKAVPAQSKHFDTTKNVVIRGDNLDALKILYQNYFGKIKMIYIDPPYNTQSENFIYKDNFKVSDEQLIERFDMKPDTVDFLQNVYGTRSHSGWLSFMYPRLKLARELLSDDGVIFISIDDHEVANLRVICDEIFGGDNFVTQLVWLNKEGGGGSDNNFFNKKEEYILAYARRVQQLNIVGHVIGNDEGYTLSDQYEQERGKYKLIKLNSFSIQYSASLDYPITLPDGSTVKPSENGKRGCWRWCQEKYQWGVENGFIEFKENQNGDLWVYTKQYFKVDYNGKPITRTLPPTSLIEQFSSTQATKNLEKLMSEKVFGYPKPYQLISYLLERHSDSNMTVLDFFAGSAPTGDAVMRLNAEDGGSRKFILVQWDEEISKDNATAHKFCTDNGLEPVISSITLERLNRAGDKVKAEIDAHNKTASDDDQKAMPDIGYKVYSTTLKPTITDAAENEQVQLQLNNQRATVLDTLTNMLCATGKTLDTRIECLIEDVLYQADDEMYLLDAVDAAVLAPHKDKKINLNGWSDIDLEGLLNSGIHTSDEITVIY